MLGVELVTDRQQKTPAKTEILHVMETMKGKCSELCKSMKLLIMLKKYHFGEMIFIK